MITITIDGVEYMPTNTIFFNNLIYEKQTISWYDADYIRNNPFFNFSLNYYFFNINMETQKTEQEWEKEFEEKFYPIFNGLAAVDGPVCYAYYDKIYEFILKTLQSQESEHKKEMEKLTLNANDHAFSYSREVQQLKKQHREELEGLKMKEKIAQSEDPHSYNDFSYNKAVKEINHRIDKLLNSQKGE